MRRVATYLRWKQDDADEIVPSLYGKGRPKSNDASSPAAKPLIPPHEADVQTAIESAPRRPAIVDSFDIHETPSARVR